MITFVLIINIFIYFSGLGIMHSASAKSACVFSQVACVGNASEGLNHINLEYLNYTSKGIQCMITFSLIISIFIYFSGLGNS